MGQLVLCAAHLLLAHWHSIYKGEELLVCNRRWPAFLQPGVLADKVNTAIARFAIGTLSKVCNIIALSSLANFHTAIYTPEWHPTRNERIVQQDQNGIALQMPRPVFCDRKILLPIHRAAQNTGIIIHTHDKQPILIVSVRKWTVAKLRVSVMSLTASGCRN